MTSQPDTARTAVWRAFWGSRLLVFLAGVVGAAQFGNAVGYSVYDPDRLTAPYGPLPNLLLSPFARWDGEWYLAVAKWGYGPQTSGVPLSPPQGLARMNFFPLYPAMIRALGWVVRSDIVAGVLISLVAFAIALTLLHRLVCIDFKHEVADATVMLLAFSPMAFYFSAIYTESLFLALSVGSILQARRGRWWWACGLAALASAARAEGVALLVPLAILYFYGPRGDADAPLTPWGQSSRAGFRRLLPRYRPTTLASSLALVPLGLVAYLTYLGLRYHNVLAPFRTQSLYWQHKSTWPFGAVWKGAVAAWHAVQQLVQGSALPLHVTPYTAGPTFTAMQDLYLFGFLVLGVVAFAGGLRRLPVAYSAYTVVSLALPLTDPVIPSPLASFPRYELVVFPLFIWAADRCERWRLTTTAIAAGAVLLGLFTAEFATWRWVG